MFKYAITRRPGANFADGLTTSGLGAPQVDLTLAQHRAYCLTLCQCGLELVELEADLDYPDSTFVEDAAVLVKDCAVLTNPGADSRKGEVAAIRSVLERYFDQIETITAPGTLDGGDICEAGTHFFIGLSDRTNEEGAAQLSRILASRGYTSSTVSIHGIKGILHLKSGITYLGGGRMVLIDALVGHEAFKSYTVIRVAEQENYAANCLMVNDAVLVPAGFPLLRAELERNGYKTIPLEMSEFQKMDGGLTCLSLRF
jgi:dimethylargininase